MIDSRHRRFVQDFVKAVGLNHSLHNLAIVGWLTALYSAVYLAVAMPWLVGIQLLSLFALLIGLGMHAVLMIDAVPSVASGEDRLPDFPEFSNWQDSIVSPILHVICTVTFLIGPWFVWRWVAPGAGIDATTTNTISWVLGVGGLLLIPIGYVGMAFGGLGVVLRYDLLIRAVIRTPVAYVILLALVVFTGWVGYSLLMSKAPASLTPSNAWFAGPRVWRLLNVPVLADAVFVYFTIVLSLTLGLYQRHFGDRFPWNTE